MANQSDLDQTFQALSNQTRREIVSQLGNGRMSVSTLAEGSEMALPSFLKHLSVLEDAGLVTSQKSGRVREYELTTERLIEAEHWMESRRREWSQRLDQLDRFLVRQEEKEND